MDLHDIRTKFCQFSGRYDLASTNVEAFDTDNGADFFINSGMKFLDRRYLTHKSRGRLFEKVAASSWYFSFQNCFAIHEVWCNDDEERWRLRKYPYQTIRDSYPDLVSDTDTGEPKFYTPVWLRTPDATDINELGTFFNHVKTDDDGTYNAIVFLPPTDGEYVIEVIGRFYHTELSSNDDENFWTNVAPDTLLKASLYQLEVFYRNTEGAKDWLAAIALDGPELEKNVVEEESNDSEVIE